MLKWKLMLTTLPFVVVILLFTFIRVQILHIPALLEFSDTGPVITATALAIGFMLAGIMADYKEAEKLPGELACILQSIDDCIQIEASQLNEADFVALKQTNVTLYQAVMRWFFNEEDAERSYAALYALLLHPSSSASFKNNALKHIGVLRRCITRVDVIRRTTFIKTGYALLEVFVTLTLGMLMFANFKNVIAQYLVIGSISLVYVYMIRLIRDLDNPFGYKKDGFCSGAAEVDYFPLTEAQQRLKYPVA